MNRRSKMLVATVATASLLLVGGCASTDAGGGGAAPEGGAGGTAQPDPVVVSFDPETKKLIPDVPVSEWCGDTPIKVGVLDGVSFNAWRQVAFGVMQAQAAQCPAVDPDIIHVSANGDQQKAISDMAALVAQGVDLIVLNGDFGQAQLPSMRDAVAAGVTVVPYASAVGGTPGVDFTASSIEDGQAVGASLAERAIELLDGKGKIIFLGGNAGAPLSQDQYDGFAEAIADHPEMELLSDEPVVTNWAKPDAQQAVAGLIARYPEIDLIYTDYGPTAIGAVNAFQAAGRKIPPVLTVASGNEVGCLWADLADTPERFELVTADSTHAMPMAGMQQGIAAATGADYNMVQEFLLPIVYDTAAGRDPQCEPDLPVDTDFTGPLSVDEMLAILK